MKVARRTHRGRPTQTSNGGNRGRCVEVTRQTLWGFDGCRECEHNFCDMARTLRRGENTFRCPCNFKWHILQLLRYVPDGNLCTASAEQLCGFNGGFPNECVAPPRCDPCRKSGGLSCRLSVPGTFETCRPALKISVHRGRPEVVGRLSNGAFDPTRKWSARRSSGDNDD